MEWKEYETDREVRKCPECGLPYYVSEGHTCIVDIEAARRDKAMMDARADREEYEARTLMLASNYKSGWKFGLLCGGCIGLLLGWILGWVFRVVL